MSGSAWLGLIGLLCSLLGLICAAVALNDGSATETDDELTRRAAHLECRAKIALLEQELGIGMEP